MKFAHNVDYDITKIIAEGNFIYCITPIEKKYFKNNI